MLWLTCFITSSNFLNITPLLRSLNWLCVVARIKFKMLVLHSSPWRALHHNVYVPWIRTIHSHNFRAAGNILLWDRDLVCRGLFVLFVCFNLIYFLVLCGSGIYSVLTGPGSSLSFTCLTCPPCVLTKMCSPQGCPLGSPVSSNLPKHGAQWTGCAKLPLDVNKCVKFACA